MDSLNNVRLNRRRNSVASRFSKSRGQSTVEFAMVALLFFMMLFAMIDYGWIMFAQMNIQQAVDDAGRYASTGQESSAGNRVQSIINVIQTEMKVPLSSWNLQICSVPPGSTTSSCTHRTIPIRPRVVRATAPPVARNTPLRSRYRPT